MLVTLCSFRADRLRAGGGERELTPFLDRLAAEGTYFENAVSASSWTKPATASLLTGLSPNVHGLIDYYPVDALIRGEIPTPRVLAEEITTLPESLREAGYATACRVNNIHAGGFFGLLQGCEDGETRSTLTTAGMVEELGRWLATVPKEQPFFFHLFSRDAHTPYLPLYEDYLRIDRSGEPWPEGRFAEQQGALDREIRRRARSGEEVPADLRQRWVDLYDAQLPALDRALARLPPLLAAAGRTEETVILVTADHGDRLFEGGQIGHGGFLDEATLAIPLIVHGASVASGKRISAVVRSIDVYPTLGDLAGGRIPAEVQGVSLLPALIGGEVASDLPAVSSFGGNLHALRWGPYRLYVGPEKSRRLVDVRDGRKEEVDLYEGQRAQARFLERELRRWLAAERALAERLARPGSRPLTAEGIQELRALGYL